MAEGGRGGRGGGREGGGSEGVEEEEQNDVHIGSEDDQEGQPEHRQQMNQRVQSLPRKTFLKQKLGQPDEAQSIDIDQSPTVDCLPSTNSRTRILCQMVVHWDQSRRSMVVQTKHWGSETSAAPA